MKEYDVVVVGAGAAGMMAAISAASTGAKTIILEHMEQAGKKILSTGNGKCNFTNQMQGVEFYRGQDPAFVLPVLQQFGRKETVDFFQKLGVFSKEKRDGYYYPANGQASAIREALLQELQFQNVDIAYEIGIRSIEKKKGRFFFHTKQGEYLSKSCIIATGGKAAKKTGSDGSGIPYILGFGHKVIEFSPALVQLQGKQSFLKSVAGVRTDARLTLYISKEKVVEDFGEVQLTEFGVSGIPAFQVSRYAVIALNKGKEVHVTLDFMPQLEADTLLEAFLFQKERNPKRRLSQYMEGFLNKKLVPVLLKESGFFMETTLKQCKKDDFKEILSQCKRLRIDIIGSKSFDHAQVCAGGVSTREINPNTMESKLVKNLFFAGEVVDIDGMCGGYNLQWAWSSGWVAGYYGGRHDSCSASKIIH